MQGCTVKRSSEWRPVSMPGLRKGLVASLVAEQRRVAALVRVVGDTPESRELQLGSRSWDQMRTTLEAAELYWVSGPMLGLAMDASRDCPAMLSVDAPSRAGMILFAEPTPPKDTTRIGGLALRDGMRTDVPYTDPVPVDGMVWQIAGGRITVDLLCLPSRLPLPLFGVDVPLVPFMRASVDVPAAFDAGAPDAQEWGKPAANDAIGPLALLESCWRLMDTPTVSERRSLDGRWGGAASQQTRPRDVVQLVDLRTLRYVRTDDDERDSSGRRLTVRFVVRGHWTHQAYGPGRSERRLQYVAPYLKGPEGAPLVGGEKVMVWRR